MAELPESLRVIIVDDKESKRAAFALILRAFGHEVLAEADSKDLAINVIDALEPDEADAILLDGNIEPGSTGGKDGAELADYVRERKLGWVIVGISNNGEISNADVNVSEPASLIDTIKRFETSRGADPAA